MASLSGFHSVHEALRSRPQHIQRVLYSSRAGASRRRKLSELCSRRGIPFVEVGGSELEQLGEGNHQGFVAETEQGASSAESAGDAELVVLVEDVQDPRNLGALLRVCEGAGVGSVKIRDRGSAPLSPTVVQTSAGAAQWLDVERITNSAQTLEQLKADGYWVYGAAAEGAPPWTIDLKGKVVLCIGGEEKGLRARTRSLCDALVGLPMRGRIESLNLSTAASAILYEAVRQREDS